MNSPNIQSFEIDLPQDDVQASVRRKLANSHAPNEKGFRAPEFMPLQYILRKFGEEFLSDILQTLLIKKVNERIAAEGWDVAHTQITGLWGVNDRPLRYRYQITLELYPEFVVQGLNTLQVHMPARTVVDNGHIDGALEVLRRNNSKWLPVDRPSRAGDRVTVNFSSMLSDGSTFPGGVGKDIGIELGAGGMLPKFEEELTGVSAGQQIDFPVCFPADYTTPVLQGRTAFFSVQVLSVTEFDLIPMDDTFPAKVGVVKGGMVELRELTRAHLQQQHDAQDGRDTDSDLLRQLAMANVVSLPQPLVGQQLEALIIETAIQRGVTPDQVPPDEGLLEQAQYRVHLAVVVRALVKQEKLNFAAERDLTEQVVEWLKARAAQNGATTP